MLCLDWGKIPVDKNSNLPMLDQYSPRLNISHIFPLPSETSFSPVS